MRTDGTDADEAPPAPGTYTELHGIAGDILRPGDHLPPQAVLHGTTWQRTGFRVGRRESDVTVGLPLHSGAVMVFNRAGRALALEVDATVLVHRPEYAPAPADEPGRPWVPRPVR